MNHPKDGDQRNSPGVRATRQRSAIAALLDGSQESRSAQQIHDALRGTEGISFATVYRTLQSMAASGLIDTLRTDTGQSVCRRCS